MKIINELLFRTVKCIDIGYVTIIYFVIAHAIGFYLDKLFVVFYGKDNDKKSTFELMKEIGFQIILVGIISYIVRNFVEYIPFPLDGFFGFQHVRLKELTDISYFAIFLMMFQYDLQDKLLVIQKKFDTKISK
jgi:hypothetical protein